MLLLLLLFFLWFACLLFGDIVIVIIFLSIYWIFSIGMLCCCCIVVISVLLLIVVYFVLGRLVGKLTSPSPSQNPPLKGKSIIIMHQLTWERKQPNPSASQRKYDRIVCDSCFLLMMGVVLREFAGRMSVRAPENSFWNNRTTVERRWHVSAVVDHQSPCYSHQIKQNV